MMIRATAQGAGRRIEPVGRGGFVDPDEERYSTIGMDALGRELVVIYTVRGERIRIISARRATRRERAEYEKQGL